MDDDDWTLDEESQEYRDYQSIGLDLSEEVNKGHHVRDLRMLIDVSPESLATMINITTNDLLAIEAGMLHLSADTAADIASALGVDLSDILV